MRIHSVGWCLLITVRSGGWSIIADLSRTVLELQVECRNFVAVKLLERGRAARKR
ncbi:hypothetical protein L195_g062490, partial [Trifolium pratense]